MSNRTYKDGEKCETCVHMGDTDFCVLCNYYDLYKEIDEEEKLRRRLKKGFETYRRTRSPNGIYEQFMDDCNKYLESKLPDVPVHVLMDISAYIANRTSILVKDELNVCYESWKRSLKR